MKHKKKKRAIFAVLYTVFGAVFVTAAVMIAINLISAQRDADEIKDLQGIYGSLDEDNGMSPGINKDPIAADDITIPDIEEDEGQEETVKPVEPALKRNLDELIKLNSDCVGWIYQKGTVINYPVMYTPSNPDKYLRRSFFGNKSTGGVLFIEDRCSLSGGHIIIYGHNMSNGTMFGSLKNYTKQSYFTKHPTFELETKSGGVKQFKIFAIGIVKIDDYVYSVTNFKNQERFDKFVNHVKSISLYDTGVVPTFGKQVVTLSTCYGKDKTNRLIVVAVSE